MHDDSVAALISHATEERLKCLIEQIKSVAQQRQSLMISVGILSFLSDLIIKSLSFRIRWQMMNISKAKEQNVH